MNLCFTAQTVLNNRTVLYQSVDCRAYIVTLLKSSLVAPVSLVWVIMDYCAKCTRETLYLFKPWVSFKFYLSLKIFHTTHSGQGTDTLATNYYFACMILGFNRQTCTWPWGFWYISFVVLAYCF